ncbi:MAG: hypothetical protein DDT28_01134 [Dehalococcoidia bacterium]|nr:hypothetical protein [Chloroflexota bacterium]
MRFLPILYPGDNSPIVDDVANYGRGEVFIVQKDTQGLSYKARGDLPG